MSDYSLSTNMNMPVPTVGVDSGPDWANNINSCLTLIDQHDHSAGFGVPISPDGISINSDLPFSNNNLTLARSIRFQSQSAVLALASDLGCLYEVGVDLYYNDGSGNQIRITQSGGVAGSPGTIANLTSPASAAYVGADSTFVWQSAASTPAYMDAASIILRNLSANSKGLTLNPPAAMGANYVLTLPTLPASTKIMQLDSSGAMSAALVVDNVTLGISANVLQVAAGGISTNYLADGAVTQAKRAALGQTEGTSTGAFNTSSNGVVVTNTTQSFTGTGRPVVIQLLPTAANVNCAVSLTLGGIFAIECDGVPIAYFSSTTAVTWSAYAIGTIYAAATAGAHTYRIKTVNLTTFSSTLNVDYCKLFIYEL